MAKQTIQKNKLVTVLLMVIFAVTALLLLGRLLAQNEAVVLEKLEADLPASTEEDIDASNGSYIRFNKELGDSTGKVVFTDDFTDADWKGRYDFDIYHRDDVLVAETSWQGDHASTGPDDECSSPDQTRTITRGERNSDFNDDWIYRCVPGGDVSKAHLMTSIGDTSGYSIGSFTPQQTFSDVSEVRVRLNTTDISSRQFTEIKIIPADVFDFQQLPCVPKLPCFGEPTPRSPDYHDLGAVGTSTHAGNNSTGLLIGTQDPESAGGWTNPSGSTGVLCPSEEVPNCFRTRVFKENSDKQTRYEHIFRDNQDGTISFLIELEDGSYEEVRVPGNFPSGDVRVVFSDHNYTFLKEEDPIGRTWHWDDVVIESLSE